MSESAEQERRSWAIALVVVVLACALITWAVRDSAGGDDDSGAEPVELSALTWSTTHTRLEGSAKDAGPLRSTDGLVIHPRKPVALYDEPAGEAFGKVGPKQFGDTWLPVVAKQGRWLKVLLPSRPNGSAGWIRDTRIDQATTPYEIRVHVGSRTLELVEDGVPVGSWTIAVGAPDTPTPIGRTFLLGQLTDPNQSFSPVILPLGTHSKTLDSYGGGPGTVAIHGWTDPSVFGQAVSHGCIRVPDEALERLRAVPLGTPVLIDGA